MKKILLTLLLLLLLTPLGLSAEEKEIPDLLNFYLRESENYRVELTPYLGDTVGDKLNHSFLFGGNLQWNWVPELGILFDFGYSPASVDRTSQFGASLADLNLMTWTAGFVTTKPAAIQNKKKTVEADFFSKLGGGVLRLNDNMQGVGFFGGGLKTRFKKVPWLCTTAQVNNYLYSFPNPSGSDFMWDVTLTAGLTFLLFPF